MTQHEVLVQFLKCINHGEDRRWLLREYVHFKFAEHHSRHEFQESQIWWNRRCFICREQGQHRHHIVPLSRGGANEQWNIVTLCRWCHKDIHRRRNGPRRKPIVGVLHKSRELGPPRFIRKHQAVADAGVFPVTESETRPSLDLAV